MEVLLRLRMGLWSLAPQSVATSSSRSTARSACKKRNFHAAQYVIDVAVRSPARLQEEEPLLAELRDMPSTHVAWLLLYFCAVPRANHLLKTVPPSKWCRTQLPTTSGCTRSSSAS